MLLGAPGGLVAVNPVEEVAAMLQVDFMRAAFVAGTGVALASGLAGYFVVLRRLAFAGDALSHVAFAGALGATLAGVPPLLGLFGATTGVAIGMGALGQRARARDEAVGTVLAWVLGLGVLFLSLYASHSARNSDVGVNVLFGSIFGLQARQANAVAAIGAGASAALIAIARPLLFATVDPDVASARGVPVRALGLVFMALLALTVGEAVQAVGALLTFALLVSPAAVAHRLVHRPFRALLLSAGLAVGLTWLSLAIAYSLPVPVSFVVATLASLAYAGVVGLQNLRRGIHAPSASHAHE